ncbi:AP2/ERF domain superfamily [Sesbania bispinosa]|nr:AP2/ERF domain superfamily [Sesbania bispinosa]
MAAAAYDVAALALKGGEAVLNFPDSVHKYPIPASKSPADIRTAATAAAQLMKPDDQSSNHNESNNDTVLLHHEPYHAGAGGYPFSETEFLDEEAIFSMPSLLVEMAEGMLLSPPRISPTQYDDNSPENSGGESLWNYF